MAVRTSLMFFLKYPPDPSASLACSMAASHALSDVAAPAIHLSMIFDCILVRTPASAISKI